MRNRYFAKSNPAKESPASIGAGYLGLVWCVLRELFTFLHEDPDIWHFTCVGH